MLEDLGPVQRIAMVNIRVNRSWEEQLLNETLGKTVATFPNAVLVNGHHAIASHPTGFYPNSLHLHLHPTDANIYAKLFVPALEETIA